MKFDIHGAQRTIPHYTGDPPPPFVYNAHSRSNLFTFPVKYLNIYEMDWDKIFTQTFNGSIIIEVW